MTKSEAYGLIVESSLFGNLGLFMGAGFSLAVNEIISNCEPLSWPSLLKKVCKEFEIQWDDEIMDGVTKKAEIKKEFKSCPEIASEICKLIAEKETISIEEAVALFKQHVCNLSAWYSNTEQRNLWGKEIQALSPNWIVTTNYDQIIETLLPETCYSLNPKEEFVFPKNKIPVYHLHGIRSDYESIIITNEDYIELSRPHNYRMDRLSVMFRESTTLMIGYGIGDQNVLMALDCSNNVYQENTSSTKKFPNGIVQLAYCATTPKDPYYDNNGILIIETTSVLNTIKEINELLLASKTRESERNEILKAELSELLNPSNDEVSNFINDNEFRISKLNALFENNENIIAKESYLTTIFDKAWEPTAANGAFDAYADYLKIIIDIFKSFEIKNIPPSLYMVLIGFLEKVSYYVRHDYNGYSVPAYRLWCSEKNSIPENNKKELINISKNSWNLKCLLRRSPF